MKIFLFLDSRIGLRGNDCFLTDAGQNCAEDVPSLGDCCLDFSTELTIGGLEVVAGGASVVHQGEEAIVGNVQELEIAALDVRDVHVVGGWADIFVLFVGEDVDADHVHLGVAVLAGLRGRHFDDLAGATLEHDEAVLAEGRALLWEGCGCAGIGGSEIEIIICHLQSTENFGSDHKKITGNRFTHWAVSNLNGYSIKSENDCS